MLNQVLKSLAQVPGAPAEASYGPLVATANSVTDFFAAVRRNQQRNAGADADAGDYQGDIARHAVVFSMGRFQFVSWITSSLHGLLLIGFLYT
jgi:hypothetical protein